LFGYTEKNIKTLEWKKCYKNNFKKKGNMGWGGPTKSWAEVDFGGARKRKTGSDVQLWVHDLGKGFRDGNGLTRRTQNHRRAN